MHTYIHTGTCTITDNAQHYGWISGHHHHHHHHHESQCLLMLHHHTLLPDHCHQITVKNVIAAITSREDFATSFLIGLHSHGTARTSVLTRVVWPRHAPSTFVGQEESVRPSTHNTIIGHDVCTCMYYFLCSASVCAVTRRPTRG